MLRRGTEPREGVTKVIFTRLTETKFLEEINHSEEGNYRHHRGTRCPEAVLTCIRRGLDEDRFKGEISLPRENREVIITKLAEDKFWLEIVDREKGDFQIVYRTPWAVITYLTWELKKTQ